MRASDVIQYISQVDKMFDDIDIRAIDITSDYMSIMILVKEKIKYINIKLENNEVTVDLLSEIY